MSVTRLFLVLSSSFLYNGTWQVFILKPLYPQLLRVLIQAPASLVEEYCYLTSLVAHQLVTNILFVFSYYGESVLLAFTSSTWLLCPKISNTSITDSSTLCCSNWMLTACLSLHIQMPPFSVFTFSVDKYQNQDVNETLCDSHLILLKTCI